MPPPKIGPWIEANSYGIIAGAVVFAVSGFAAWNAGQATMRERLMKLEARIEAVERAEATSDQRLDDNRPALICAVRTLDRLTERAGIEPPCQIELPE